MHWQCCVQKQALGVWASGTGHWTLHKDVTLISNLDGDAVECGHTATAPLPCLSCGSFSSLMSGDISLLWHPERQSHAGSLLLKASHCRPSSLGNWHSWRLSVYAGMEIVHFSVRNHQKWRELTTLIFSFAFWKKLAFHQQRYEPGLRLHYPEAGTCVSLYICKLGTSVFLWVCVPMCVYACLHPSLCFSLWVHIYEQVCKRMCECVLMWAYICLYKYMSVYVWVLHTCVNMCFCMCRYVHVSYACLCMCMHKTWIMWHEKSHMGMCRAMCVRECLHRYVGTWAPVGIVHTWLCEGMGIYAVSTYHSSAVEIHLRLPLVC